MKRPLQPKHGNWHYLGSFEDIEFYYHPIMMVQVGSAIHITNRQEEYCLTISKLGKKALPSERLFALDAFEAADFEHDNHGNINTDSFWKPVNKDLIGECECKK